MNQPPLFYYNILFIFAMKSIGRRMVKIKKRDIAWMLLVLLTSCDGIFDTHPYDVNISGERNINVTNIKKIEESCKDKDTLRIACISDTHVWFSDTEDMVNDINARSNVDFVIHCGDLSDTGVQKEFEWTRSILGGLSKPYVALIGNHDFLGTGDEVFSRIWGDYDFSFIAARVKFVCLNTNAIEYNYLAAVPNFDFMEEQIKQDSASFDRTIVCMHARPYCEQFNNNVAKAFEFYIHLFPHTMFCINGHDHSLQVDDIYKDGIIYYGIDCASSRTYLLFTITPTDYKYEVIHF